jgi:flagellar hook-length control protein FliK
VQAAGSTATPVTVPGQLAATPPADQRRTATAPTNSPQASATPTGVAPAGPDTADTPVAAVRRGTGRASGVPDEQSGPDATPAVATPATAEIRRTDVAAPVSAPASTGTPTPASQVAMHLIPLRKGPDGVHRMTIHLNPDGLGPITVVAQVRHGDISVQLAGVTEAGREALAAGLQDLRKDLLDSGFGKCSLDLKQDAPGQGQGQGRPDGQAPTGQPGGDLTRRQDRGTHHAGGTGREYPVGTAPEQGGPTPVRTTGHRALDLHM